MTAKQQTSSRTVEGVVRLKNQLSEIVGCLQTKRLPRDVDGCVRWNKVEEDMHRAVDEMVRANARVSGPQPTQRVEGTLDPVLDALVEVVRTTPQKRHEYMCHGDPHCYSATDYGALREQFKTILSNDQAQTPSEAR